VREILATPKAIGLLFEEIPLVTSDNTKLNSWFVPAAEEKAVVLLCHGNAGNISHRLDLVRILHLLQYSVFLFDYRGYGKSEGKPGEEGTYKDGEAAWAYLVGHKKRDPKKIVLMGRSLGGAVAANLAGQYKPGALILESTFTSVPDLGAEHYWFVPVRAIARFHYNTKKYLAKVTVPVLVMHSRSDEMIPYNHGQALFEAAGELKEFCELTGTHNEGFLATGQAYPETIKNFIEIHIK
jgi:alpha-beta hydrolase superfamily lysophospholipase